MNSMDEICVPVIKKILGYYLELNPNYRRREATKHQDRTYRLYRQPITRTGTLMFYKYLEPYNPTLQHIESDFNWEVFEASRGSDMDIDIRR